ncbi:MAG: hypothetical protein FD170_3357 [Bacteroidetes bacterium]|nr:MAG: hypothetical protein FD170_3357 [Bacteroidota bacterium]
MENKIGETVIFPKDLHCEFSVENIEQLKVYSFSKKDFDNCEDWSADEKRLDLKIADFFVSITKKRSRFIYASGVSCGYFYHEPEKLYFITEASRPKGFVHFKTYYFEKRYAVPKSMWDFGNLIDGYLAHVMLSRLNLQKQHTLYLAHAKHRQYLKNANKDTHLEHDDDLPF